MSKFCTQCGKPVSPTQKFCTSCGKVLSPTPVAHYTSPAQSVQPAAAPTPAPGYAPTVVVNEPENWNTSVITPQAPSPVNPTVVEEVQPTVIEEIAVEAPFQPAVITLTISDVSSGQQAYTLELGLDSEILVGRDGRAVTVKIDDPRSSRQHFSIKLGSGEFIVTDLASSNGTFINGLKVVEPARLMDGDTIAFGRSEAVFRLVSAPSAWGDSSTHS